MMNKANPSGQPLRETEAEETVAWKARSQHPATGQDAHAGGAERPAYAVGEVWVTRAYSLIVITRRDDAKGPLFGSELRYGEVDEWYCDGTFECEGESPHDLTAFIAHSISDLASIAQEGRPEDWERIAGLEAENARLRTALDEIGDCESYTRSGGATDGDLGMYEKGLDEALEIARAALSSGEA